MKIRLLRRSSETKVWRVYTDGAIQPLYAMSGLGVVVCDETGKMVRWWQAVAGGMTCNEAEYAAALFALKRLEDFRPLRLTLCSDSQVLVNQMRGEAQTHAPELRRMQQMLSEQARRFGEVRFEYVPREVNRVADALAVTAILRLKAVRGSMAREWVDGSR